MQSKSTQPLIDALRAEALKRLETGELPRYAGRGSTIIGLSKVRNGKPTFLILVPDSWCLLTKEQLYEQANRLSKDWVRKAGKTFYVGNHKQSHSIKSLADLIRQKVAEALPVFEQGREEWQTRLEKAQQKIRQEQASKAWIKSMINELVNRAQQHIVNGARLRELARQKPPGKTLAEKWHLYSFDEFNLRALPEVIRTEEQKDENGHVIKSRTWVENQGGGEAPAAAEQARFLIQGIAQEAEKGNEAGMHWLYHVAMFATAEFWHAVEVQKNTAKKLSAHWARIPVHWCDEPHLHKALQKQGRGLQLPKLPAVSGKIKPDSPQQIAVSRTQSALNFLIRSPISLPPMPDGSRSDLFDDHLPVWLKKALTLDWNRSTDLHEAAEVLWDVYVAAMTATPKSPWRANSRPRKAKEHFIKAVLAHRPKTH
ncbi:MAG: hypothetical protein U1F81_01620 [Verrucomicrobiaceae bacterium]